MRNKINRRSFIKKSGYIGATGILGSSILPKISKGLIVPEEADISVVEGTSFFDNTIKSIELLGGMQRFVSEGSKVGLLINSDFDQPGAYVNPDITIAAVKMMFEAGASGITLLQVVKPEYWERSAHYEDNKTMISELKVVKNNAFPAEYNEEDFVKLDKIDGGKSLKETEVVKKWLDCDVFVNIPISKHHMTTLLTGAIKNIMGVSTRKANITFHLGSGERNDPDYLAQCLADQNLLKKTDLCIVDSTSFITNNGPAGPGDIKTLNKIVAGSDIVAIDALCSTFLGYEPEEVIPTVKAHEAGIGEIDYQKLKIIEV